MLSDQLIASFSDDVIPHYDDVIPECYATNMPYMWACKTWVKSTSMEAEDKQNSQQKEKAGSKARGDTPFQKLGYRQEGTIEARDNKQQMINKLALEQKQLPIYAVLHY